MNFKLFRFFLYLFLSFLGVNPAFAWDSEKYQVLESDVNSDGITDYLIKSNTNYIVLHGKVRIILGLLNDPPHVLIESSVNGYQVTYDYPRELAGLPTWVATDNEFLIGDLNLDGFKDLVIQAGTASETTLVIHQGTKGSSPTIANQINATDQLLDLSVENGISLSIDDASALLKILRNGEPVKNPLEPSPLLSISPSGNKSNYSLNVNAETSGIGATDAAFNVTASGKPNYEVPISLPPSVNNISPALSVRYSGQDHNGPFGVGWHLDGLSEISRCPSQLDRDGYIQGVLYQNTDRFCLNGVMLQAISGVYGADQTEYRTSIESFAKILSYGDGPDYFKIWHADGKISYLGQTATAKKKAVNGRTFQWWVNQEEDRFGNAATYTYETDEALGTHFIKSINFDANRVTFEYEARSDKALKLPPGIKALINQRVAFIKTYVGASLARSYQLNYETSTSTKRSRLISIKECARGTYCLPATQFTWENTSDEIQFVAHSDQSFSSVYPAGASVESISTLTADLNNDGRSDLVWTYRNNNKLGWATFLADGSSSGYRLDEQEEISEYLVGSIDDAQQRFMTGDVTGDGRADILWVGRYLDDIYRVLWVNTPAGFSYQGYMVDSDASNRNIETMDFQLTDISGDGRDDLIAYSTGKDGLGINTYLAVNNGNGYALAKTENYRDEDLTPNFYKYHQFASGDVNGDGKSDLVWSFTLDTKLYLSLYLSTSNGAGFKHVSTRADALPTDVNLAHVQLNLLDINGDGKKEPLWSYMLDNQLHWRLYRTQAMGNAFETLQNNSLGSIANLSSPKLTTANLNGDEFSDALFTYVDGNDFHWRALVADVEGKKLVEASNAVIARNDTVYNNHEYLTGDINADGRTDLIWSFNHPGTQDIYHRTYKLPAQHADHIEQIHDGLGNQIKIDYAYLADNSAGIYTTDQTQVYPNRLDAGLSYVVKKVSQSNGVGGLNDTEFSYKNAVTHLRGYGFQGFSERTTEDKVSGISTQETYRQGYPYLGQLSATIRKKGAKTLDATYIHWEDLELSSGTNFKFPSEQLRLQYETDGGLVAAHLTQFTYDNTHGAVASQVETFGSSVSASIIGNQLDLARGFTSSDISHKTLTLTTGYEFNHESTAHWRIGFPSVKTVKYEAVGESPKTRVTKNVPYHNDAHLLGSQENFSGTQVWTKNKYAYYPSGRLKSTTTTAARASSFIETYTYTSDNLFPKTFKNGENLTFNYKYNAFNGLLEEETDPNGLRKHTFYDDFGRLVSVKNRDASILAYNYATSGLVAGAAYKITQSLSRSGVSVPGMAKTITYFDAFNREIERRKKGFSNETIKIKTSYDARGRKVSETEPYTATVSPTNLYVYDDLNRITRISEADGGIEENIYSSLSGIVSKQLEIKKTIKNPAKTVRTREKRNSLDQIVEVIDDYAGLGVKTELDYDSQGHLDYVRVNNQTATLITKDIDVAGNITEINDPDAGIVSKTYNGLAQLIEQSQGVGTEKITLDFSYDKAGRLTQRRAIHNGTTETYEWKYDGATNGKGYVDEIIGPDYYETLAYDNVARVKTRKIKLKDDAEHRILEMRYDGYSRPTLSSYPNRLEIGREYNNQGYLKRIKDARTQQLLYEVLSQSPRDQITRFKLGATQTTRTYDSANGYLAAIETSGKQNHNFSFDTVGHLQSRNLRLEGESYGETFSYDNLFRLRKATTTGLNTGTRVINYQYDSLGNLKTKSDVSNTKGYTYGANGAGPHAVTKVTQNTNTTQLNYDSRGNMVSKDDTSIRYNAFNQPIDIVTPSTHRAFQYGPDQDLTYQETRDMGITQTARIYSPSYQEEARLGVQKYKANIDGLFSYVQTLYMDNLTIDDAYQYQLRDHQESLELVLDASGESIQSSKTLKFAYAPFGQRREHNGEELSLSTLNDLPEMTFDSEANGYTDQLHLDQENLIHMGKRLYDPALGRFMSPDPFVQFPYLSQSYNRYSYTLNSPLSYKDPTGEALVPLIVAGAVVAWRAYSAYDLAKTVEAEAAILNDPSTSLGDKMLSMFNIGSSAIGGKGGRAISGKITGRTKAIAPKRPTQNIAKSKEPKAQGKDGNTQKSGGDGEKDGGDGASGVAKGTKGLETRGVKPAPGTRVRPEGIPEGWRIRPTKSKGGTEYYNPKNPNESVRVMQGNPNSPYPNSQRPYARQRDNSGSYLDANGNRGVNKSSDTHVPLDQFKFRE